MNEPVLMTINVGESTSKPRQEVKRSKSHIIHLGEVDSLLKKYDNELKSFGSLKTGDDDDGMQTLSIHDAEVTRIRLMDEITKIFDHFIQQIRQTAKNTTVQSLSNLAKDTKFAEYNLSLDLTHVPIEKWRNKYKELQARIANYQTKDRELKSRVEGDLKKEETSVGTHLAHALNQSLDASAQNYEYDVAMLNRIYTSQNNIMNKMMSSYLTFYSWILEHWNRNLRYISQTYEKVHSKIQSMFNDSRLNSDIEQLLDRYEIFLKTHEALLPMEFTLSANPRRQWRTYLAQNQPEECIRLMQNELRSLENIPQLYKSVSLWNQELQAYDLGRLESINDKKLRLKKRLEDAVDVETKHVCHRKWIGLNQHIYNMGIGIQEEASNKLSQVNSFYSQHQKQLLHRQNVLQNTQQGYESRLALIDRPWASWLEKRKYALREWGALKYWEIAIESLIGLYDVAVQFQDDINKLSLPTKLDKTV